MFSNQALLQERKQKLPENLQDDIRANDEIYDDVIGIDAPGCLRSSIVVSKKKNVTFTTQEEFDRAAQVRANEIVADIQKGFEEKISKFKDDYCSNMEMLKARILALEGQNVNVSQHYILCLHIYMILCS